MSVQNTYDPCALRRSERLQEMGYYNNRISYAESRPTKLFYPKKYNRRNAATRTQFADEDILMNPSETSEKASSTFGFFHLLLFVLSFTFVYGGIQVSGMFHVDNVKKEEDMRRTMLTNQERAMIMPDFASDSLGGEIVYKFTSRHLPSKKTVQKYNIPEQVIGPKRFPLFPGQCWPVKGQQAQLTIKLGQRIHITSVTVGHISKEQSPTGEISSAPKSFTVFGRRSRDAEEVTLGSFEYDSQIGVSFQTFEIEDHRDKDFAYVRLAIESNHGKPEYTCLYDFKVHGNISEAEVIEEKQEPFVLLENLLNAIEYLFPTTRSF